MESVQDLMVGQIVRSKAGRDKDRYYIVIKTGTPGEVWVADGKYRPLESPKRKKIKHLQKQNLIAEDVRRRLSEGARMENSFLREALKKFIKSSEIASGGGAPGGEERCD